ncbi:hypothetical protein AAIR29_09350 [Psychrobacter sp. FBL11]|uniref:Uncharacterized protein n=1 Tax=Psychrobacter saeujeotis TaxID=3143436 RepID=A0ABU9X8Y9_9GAMM|nr:hypothetical protein [uncultured Psychrobacter sp.]
MDVNVIASLKRSIINRNGLIKLETEELEDLQYAFYLRHSKGLEKQFYTSSPSKCFDVSFDKGDYLGTFYYMYNKKRVSFKVNFYIDDQKNLVELNLKNIVEEVGYKIDYYSVGSKKTFIVFNGAGSTKTANPFGLNYLVKNGFNVVSCLQNDNQYQELSFKDFEKYIYPLVHNHDVYLYGSSLGGYCALYYAGAVNGTVISAAPRNSSHPLLVDQLKDKSYFGNQEFKHLSFNENKISSKDIYIFFDPHVKEDVYFIDNVVKSNFENIKLFECNHSGHQVLYHLNKTKQLGNVLKSITNGLDPVIDEIESCYTYIGKAKYYFSRKDYEKAVFFSEKSLEDKFIDEKFRLRFEKLHEAAVRNYELSKNTL